MRGTLRYLIDISVDYLSLNRGVPTLSGGESPRVKMARQLDCDLVNLIYILDEPTVGLHPRDIDHLIAMLHRPRDHHRRPQVCRRSSTRRPNPSRVPRSPGRPRVPAKEQLPAPARRSRRGHLPSALVC